jgi:hypothetical protein
MNVADRDQSHGIDNTAARKTHFRNGVLTLVGGVSIQLFNGCFFLWANISLYIVSYMHQFDPNVGQGATFYVDVALTVLCVVGY